LKFREGYISRRGPRISTIQKSSTSSSAGLLAGDSLALEEGRSNEQPKPGWLRYIDEANLDIATIKGKIKELDKLHQAHIRSEHDDDVQSEQAIEILTTEITKLFRSAQSAAVRTKKMAAASEAEAQMRDNMTSKVAGQLQDVSSFFRKKQQNYLREIQRLQNRTRSDLFGTDNSLDFDGFVDKGFSQQNMAVVDNMSHTINQRDQEIVKIAKNIEELAGLFKDLSFLVVEQGTVLDRIDYNIEQVDHNVNQAIVQLRKGAEYQKKARTKMCMLILCVLILIAIVALIVKGAV